MNEDIVVQNDKVDAAIDGAYVPIESSDVYWAIYVTEPNLPEGQLPAGQKHAIQLEWGWTAGMSEEELKGIAEDSPMGKEHVRITLDMAEKLRDDLTAILAKHKAT